MKNLITFVLIALASQAMSSTLEEATMSERHEKWMAFHGRAYVNDSEKERRFMIFKENVEYIEEFNKDGNNTYKLGVNQFADLTNEEFLASHTGYKRSTLPRTLGRSFRYRNMSAVPPSMDWRSLGAVTPVKSQGGCGCCWAFSAVGALEGITKIKTGKLISLSEQEILDCDGANNGCRGDNMQNAFNFVIKNHGIATEANYPYIATEKACNWKAAFPAAKITGYVNVPHNDESALLWAVAKQPVSVAVDPSRLHFYRSGILSGQCGLNLHHALTAIGYGTSKDGTKYWLLKNSWSTLWGEGGFVRMQRESGPKEGICGIAMDPSYPTA